MNKVLCLLKNEATAMAARLELPDFYLHCNAELQFSRETFFDHPLILRLQEDVLPFLYDGYGHGIEHSKKVAIEGSAIILAEASNWDLQVIRHLALLAQACGLLHDICRLERNHAAKGADLAQVILHNYPLSDRDKQMISFAIDSHEAFRPEPETSDMQERLLASALYDADKFRWGPDNFVTTLWEICDYEDWPLSEILKRFPEGMEKISSIASTFRTQTGQTYGPEMIEMGITLGRGLYARLQDLCVNEDCDQNVG